MGYRYQDLKPGDAYFDIWQQFRVHWKCARLVAWYNERFQRQFALLMILVALLSGWWFGFKYFVIVVFISFVFVQALLGEVIEKQIYKYPRLVPRDFLGIPMALHCPKCGKLYFESLPGIVRLSGPLFDSAQMEILDEDHAKDVIGGYLADLHGYESEKHGEEFPVLGPPVTWDKVPEMALDALRKETCKSCGLPLWAPDDPDKENNHEPQDQTL